MGRVLIWDVILRQVTIVRNSPDVLHLEKTVFPEK